MYRLHGLIGLLVVPLSLWMGDALASEVREKEPIRPLIASPPGESRKVDLGRRLFHDPILSGDGTVSCASCHDLARGGVDGLPVSVGVGGAKGSVNAPTVFNAAFHLAQFWDGRAATLEEQAGGPITNPLEMANSWPVVLARLNASAYFADFKATFGGEATASRVKEAIAAFERTLVSTDSPFDRWLLGDDTAMTSEELRGYRLFKSFGCISCHQGRNVGGNMYQRFGFFGDWFADRGRAETAADLGRFNVTGRAADRHVFKVPSLRLAVQTAPYFHDGSVATLEEAVRLMARYQLGRPIAEEEVGMIVKFLHTLPGKPAEPSK